MIIPENVINLSTENLVSHKLYETFFFHQYTNIVIPFQYHIFGWKSSDEFSQYHQKAIELLIFLTYFKLVECNSYQAISSCLEKASI